MAQKRQRPRQKKIKLVGGGSRMRHPSNGSARVDETKRRGYEAQASSSSRNQNQLSGPVIGKIVRITQETIIYGTNKDGSPKQKVVEVKPYDKLVHPGQSEVVVRDRRGYTDDALMAG